MLATWSKIRASSIPESLSWTTTRISSYEFINDINNYLSGVLLRLFFQQATQRLERLEAMGNGLCWRNRSFQHKTGPRFLFRCYQGRKVKIKNTSSIIHCLLVLIFIVSEKAFHRNELLFHFVDSRPADVDQRHRRKKLVLNRLHDRTAEATALLKFGDHIVERYL